MTLSLTLFWSIKPINAISINASKNIQTTNELPSAISVDFTIEDKKNAIPKNVKHSEKSSTE